MKKKDEGKKKIIIVREIIYSAKKFPFHRALYRFLSSFVSFCEKICESWSQFLNPLTANDEFSRHEHFDLFMDLDTEVGT